VLQKYPFSLKDLLCTFSAGERCKSDGYKSTRLLTVPVFWVDYTAMNLKHDRIFFAPANAAGVFCVPVTAVICQIISIQIIIS